MDAIASLFAKLRDRYRIERELGRGAMATVYLAEDVRHERLVALKVLDPDLGARLGAERFLAEIKTTARLQHPNIMPLHDSGEVNGILFYVMPFVEGETLRQRLARESRLPIDDAVRLAREVADALAEAHGQGIVHRDVKPENILLKGGHALVADFGIAFAVQAAGGQRMTQTGLALGTPQYMSPEQANGERDIDARTDVHALGSVLYEMLTGASPFAGSSTQAVLTKLLTARAPPVTATRPEIPRALEQIVSKCLEAAATDRYANGRELADALAAIPTGSHSRPRIFARVRRPSRRFLVGAMSGAVAVAAVAAWSVVKGRGTAADPTAGVIAVVPFIPASPDTALTRVGLDLATTISASLDGIAEIHTVDRLAILAQAGHSSAAGLTLAAAGALARRFGASRVLAGSLVRVGDRMRLDAALYDSRDLRVIARTQMEAAPNAIDVVTDSVSHALLAQIWQHGPAPSPSVDVALKTRSLPALQAFLEGERFVAEDHWQEGAERYQRAFVLDSTFWLAASRLRYAQTWAHGEVDSSTIRALNRHRAELPKRERLLDEAASADSFTVIRNRLEQVTTSYPDSWLGWLAYGDFLLHSNPLIGGDVTAARPAFDQAVALNPGLLPAWDHMLMLAFEQRDSAGTRRAVEGLGRLPSLSGLAEYWCGGTCNFLLQARYADQLVRTDGHPSDALRDSVDRDIARTAPATNIAPRWAGFYAAQIARRHALHRTLVDAERIAGSHEQLALDWAGRGAWDSALVAARDLGSGAPGNRSPLLVHQLATIAFWAGAGDSLAVSAARPAAARAAQMSGARNAARFHWFDAVGAFARADRAALAAARSALRQTKDPDALELDSALALFEARLAHRGGRPGRSLAAMELAHAERGYPGALSHAFSDGVHRLAAAKWLLEEGDTTQAARVLTWHEAFWNAERGGLTALVYLERARIDEARGNVALARDHYTRFLWRYDLPMAWNKHLVAEAKQALIRLATTGDTKRP